MANSDVVQVAVEIVDNFSDELTELESRLEKIDGKTLNVDLEIDDSDIQEVKAQLESLEQDINSTLDIDVSGYTKAKAQKEDLEGDMHSTLHLGVDQDRLTGLGNLNGGEGFNPPSGMSEASFRSIFEQADINTQFDSDSGSESKGNFPTPKGFIPDQFEVDTPDEIDVNAPDGVNVDIDTDSIDELEAKVQNLRGFEGSSVEFAESVRRFSPEERETVNDFMINPAVAKVHNRGIDKDDRDGWIGPSNWEFGIGEKFGPEPRYPGDKKEIDGSTDFLRSIKEMTDSLPELENVGRDIDETELTPEFDVGFGRPDDNRNAAEIDFLKRINTATTRAENVEIGDTLFSDAKFGDLEVQTKNIDTGLFAPDIPELDIPDMDMGDKSRRGVPDSIGNQLGYYLGRSFQTFRSAPQLAKNGYKKRTGRNVSTVGNVMGSLGGLAADGIDMLAESGGDDSIMGNLKKKLKKLVPSMQKWYRLVALAIPLLITMAGAAIGAAAALGALAIAGAAMVGIGLLGFGDSLSESLRNAQKRAKQLKSELFDVFQPVAGVFQPFVEQLFDKIPQQAAKLTEPLKGLEAAGFDDFFIGALEGTADFFVRLIELTNELAPEIQAIGGAIGQIFGNLLIDLLRWSVKELYNNWDAFSRLGAILIDLLVILYNLSKAVSFALSYFKPLFDIIVGISDAVGNKMTASILAGVAAMMLLFYAGTSVAAVLTAIKGLALASAIYGIVSASGSLLGALAAVAGALTGIIAQLTAIQILTGGLMLLAGLAVAGLAYDKLKETSAESFGGNNSSPSGFGSPSPMGAGAGGMGGAGGGTQINIYGDVRRDEYQRLKDEFPNMYQEQKEIDENTQR